MEPPAAGLAALDGGTQQSFSPAAPEEGPAPAAKGASDDKKELSRDQLLLAATLVLDAKSGHNMYFKPEGKYVKAYIWYHKWYLQWTLYILLFLNLALAIFEKPAVPNCEVPWWGTLILEIICFGYFIFRILHTGYFSEKSNFWKDTKNLIVVGIVTLSMIDIFCYIIWVTLAPNMHPVRWSRPLRPFLFVNFPEGRQVRQAFRNIRKTLPEVLNIFILFTLSLLLFALLALKLFSKRGFRYPNNENYFQNYLDSVWDLYVLVTTANNPDIMMPAYDANNWYAIFFIAYIIVCLYIFMSIVLAAIYNNYRNNLKNEVKQTVFGKRRRLAQAFDIVKVWKNGSYIVSKDHWYKLMHIVSPERSKVQLDLLMQVLDSDGSNSIKKRQFLTLADLLQVPLSEVRDRMTWMEKTCPILATSLLSHIIKTVVRHKLFRWFFDLMIFINAWIIGFDVDSADWFFLSIFIIEICLKLYTFSVKFFYYFWNVFDFFVIFGALVLSVYEFIRNTEQNESYILDLFLVLRVLRLFKTFGSFQRFRVVIMTVVNIAPSISTYGGVLLVFYYFFAIIGMESFNGLINYYGYNISSNLSFCGDIKLKNTEFFHEHYCSNNFNNILKSFVVLFELTVVNQWHVITSGFVHVTHKAARIYFLTFHICCVVIVLNIFVAFVLEAFILEYSLQKVGKLESDVEAKIKELGLGMGMNNVQPVEKVTDKQDLVSNQQPPGTHDQVRVKIEEPDDASDNESIPDVSSDDGLRFHLKKKNRKKMRVLLQQMFEGEIDPEDDGHNADRTSQGLTNRKLTFDSVTGC